MPLARAEEMRRPLTGPGEERAMDEKELMKLREELERLKGENEASSMTARTDPSNRIGRTMILRGVALPRPELILT